MADRRALVGVVSDCVHCDTEDVPSRPIVVCYPTGLFVCLCLRHAVITRTQWCESLNETKDWFMSHTHSAVVVVTWLERATLSAVFVEISVAKFEMVELDANQTAKGWPNARIDKVSLRDAGDVEVNVID